MRLRADEVHLWLGAGRAGGVLRRYVDAPEIATGPHGKPYLRNSDLHFNVSHSGDLRVLAVATREVGVDVEVLRDRGDVRELAAVGLPPEQAAQVAAAPEAERDLLFHRLWVRHEARLKCHGVGLVAPLPADARDRVVELDLGPGAVGALALQESARASAAWPPPITGFQWEQSTWSTGSTTSAFSAARSASTVPP